MKILVTGHKGFIGQNMVKALEADGHEVIGYEWGEEFYSLYKVDQVIHLGAISSTTFDDIPQILDQNYYFTIDLLKECNARKTPIQIASSASLYGINNKTFHENDKLYPRTPYAWTKLLCEDYIKRAIWNMKVQVFRYFNVYGPNEDHKGSQASPFHQFEKQAKETGVIKVFQNSEAYFRDFVHVDKVIDVHKKFFDVKESGIWNVGTGHCTSFMRVAIDIAEKYNAKIETIPMPKSLVGNYQHYTKADLTLLNSTLGSL